MTLFALLYYVLLVAWLPLLWPALRLRGWARRWLLMVVAAGAGGAAYEVWRTVWAPAAIRLDIVLLSIVLGCLYASAVAVLLRARRRTAAAVLGLVVVLTGAGMSYEWIKIGVESERLTEVFHASNALLFEAKFRDRDTYERTFGPFTTPSAPHPVGHWEARDDAYYSRLIVNGEGRAWLFFRCGDTECPYGHADPGLLSTGDEANERWEATLKPRAGVPMTVRIAREGPGRLSLRGNGRSVLFDRAPPPVDADPAPESLVFLGPFAKVACRGQHADVRQLWLWRQGARLYALGVFSTLLAGRRADFVHPALMGEGENEGNTWRFEWERQGSSWRASIELEDGGAILDLERPGLDPERALLRPGAIFRDEAIELAPLTAWAHWEHWFDIVLVGHFASGEVPAC